jgi:acyl transferase domain-containing protein
VFAVGVGLAELLRAAGVQPAAVVGHSHGEITAAYVAGGLSLQDAARTVAVRGRALRRLEGKGAVVALSLSSDSWSRPGTVPPRPWCAAIARQ